MAVLSGLLSGIALFGTATAAPQLAFGSASGVVAGQCAGQSCQIANLAGITGQLPTIVPKGGSSSGWKCVSKFHPEGVAAVEALQGKSKSGLGSLFGGKRGNPSRLPVTPSLPALGATARDNSKRQLFGDYTKYKGKCADNILLYTKGTTEMGEEGSSVGPKLRSAMSSAIRSGKWFMFGINYTADMAGNNCVGLLGGDQARQVLEDAAQKCPNAKLYTSGYSQGAMVARIAVAYTTPQIKARVKGILTFGDPFNGAKVKGYNGPIKTFCASADAVCTGAFTIGSAHFSYFGLMDSSVAQGWRFLQQQASAS